MYISIIAIAAIHIHCQVTLTALPATETLENSQVLLWFRRNKIVLSVGEGSMIGIVEIFDELTVTIL
jgi:hypothetical protein